MWKSNLSGIVSRVLLILATSSSAYAESDVMINRLLEKNYRHQFSLKKQTIVPNQYRQAIPLERPALDVVVRTPTVTKGSTMSVSTADSQNCEVSTSAAECGHNHSSLGAGLSDYLQGYGMFAVVGTGLRLPDEQLESEDGLEDDW